MIQRTIPFMVALAAAAIACTDGGPAPTSPAAIDTVLPPSWNGVHGRPLPPGDATIVIAAVGNKPESVPVAVAIDSSNWLPLGFGGPVSFSGIAPGTHAVYYKPDSSYSISYFCPQPLTRRSFWVTVAHGATDTVKIFLPRDCS